MRLQLLLRWLHLRFINVLLAAVLVLADNAVHASELLIEHVTVVSAERSVPLRDARVTIRDDRISEVTQSTAADAKRAPGVQVVDGRGLYLAPGLIDSHVHLNGIPGMTDEQERAHPEIARDARAQIPRSYLYFGYTTLVDLVDLPGAMARWQAEPLRPDTYFCGAAAVMDGYPMHYSPGSERYRLFPYFLIEPGSAPPPGINPADHTPEAVVQRMKSDGASCVKTFFERGFDSAKENLPVPSLSTIRALVRAAHAAGLPVLIHANGSEGQRFAVDAGVDIIAHGLWNWSEPRTVTEVTPGVRDLLDGIVAAQIGWQPTVQVLAGLRDQFEPSILDGPHMASVLPAALIEWYRTPEGQWFRQDLEQGMGFPPSMSRQSRENQARQMYSVVIRRDERAVAYLNLHGAHFLFGTDTPSAPTYANPPGLNGWLEMHDLLAAGMTPVQVFLAATLANAQALHLPEVGTVEAGKRANLLLLTQDPTQTIEAYDHIIKLILGGRVIDREGLDARHLHSIAASARP